MKSSKIVAVWNEIEDGDPDISTERLLEMTARRCRCDVDDVIDALKESGDLEKVE